MKSGHRGKLPSFGPWGLTARLLTMNAIVFGVFLIISIAVLVLLRHVEGLLGETISIDLDRNIRNTRILADLSGIFDDASLLTSTFYKRDALLAEKSVTLVTLADSLADRADDLRLKASVIEFAQSMRTVFDQCRRINDILKRLDGIDVELGRRITTLEKAIAEKKVRQVLRGEDPTYIEQLGVSASGYRETILQINVLLGRTGYEHFSVLKGETAKPILSLLDDLARRVQVLAATDPEIAVHGAQFTGALRRYRAAVVEYFDDMGVLRKRHNALETSKRSVLQLMCDMEIRISLSASQMRTTVGEVMRSSRTFIVVAALLVISALLVLTVFFILTNIRKPMRQIRAGLDAIRTGDLSTTIALGRRDEWQLIEEGVNEMARELQGSYRELAGHQLRLEQVVQERTRQLEDAHAELVRQERLAILGRLTATVSHELRNPLGVIRHSAFYLQRRLGPQDEKVAKHLVRIEEQVALCDAIVEDLLEYTRGRIADRRMNDFNDWLGKTLESLSVPPEIAVGRQFDGALPSFFFDSEKMRRVMINVFSNAVQAVQSRVEEGPADYAPHIDVTTQRLDDSLVITVRDNGVGMSEETLSHAFEPLFTTRARGTGLGLAIVKKIVDEHSGRVYLDSRAGSGATATIILPLSGASEGAGSGMHDGTSGAQGIDQKDITS